MNERLRGYGPEIDRELNDYPATLIIRTVKWRLKTDASFREAVRHVKDALVNKNWTQKG